MIFIFESVLWALVIALAFAVITLPITIPLALWLHLFENAGGGPYFRGIRRANRKAERDYVRSLSPEDRKAYWWHEKRKRQFTQWTRLFWLGKLTPRIKRKYKGDNFDDVTGAPDSPDGENPDRNLLDDGPWAAPRVWQQPKWK